MAPSRGGARRQRDAEFWVVGGGVRLNEVTALARQRGLGDRMRFFGHRDDVPALLAASDAFVLPSRSEAMPNGVIEAMAAGLPIIATAVGGIPEIVTHGETALLVRPDDAPALASAMLTLINAPERAAGFGAAARRAVERRFSFDRMVSGFEQVYLSELQAHAPKLVPNAELLVS